MATSSFDEPNLQAIIENIALDENFKKPKFKISSATNPGKNFIARLYRIEITDSSGDEKYLSLILKATTMSRARQILTSSDKLFRNETAFYETILPTLNSFLNKHGVIHSTIFPGTVRYFGSYLNEGWNKNQPEVIVLEDKKPDGYIMKDAIEGIGVVECQLILQRLALLHASSMALRILEPETAQRLEEMTEKTIWPCNEAHPALNDFQELVSAALSFLGEPYEKGHPVYDKIFDTYQNLSQFLVKLNKAPEDIACIIHGDCWIGNVLFGCAQNGSVEDVCIIDYQLARVCSPAIDLMFTLMLSTTKELRDQHFEGLLRCYHDEVCRILKAVGCDPEKIFSWDRLQDHLSLYGGYGLVWCLIAFPIFMADTAVDVSTDDGNKCYFAGIPTVTKPENVQLLRKKITDAVTDAVRLGCI